MLNQSVTSQPIRRQRRSFTRLAPGDVIEVTVEGVGTIRNRVVAEHGALDDWRWRPGR